MPIAIIPDVDEQRCIGCALCVEICTALGPDVLRVKPVEGWKRGMSNSCNILDEANGIYFRTTSATAQEWCILKRLGRRLNFLSTRRAPNTNTTFLF
jgi:Fe-S-cluster-containing hydrogenase component 2